MTDFSIIAPLMHTDAYKLGHRRQYELAGDVSFIYSNYTNRRSRIKGVGHVVHFGLQAFIQHYLMDAFEPFYASNQAAVEDAYFERVKKVLGRDAALVIGADHIGALHAEGHLPLRFCALPEGTLVPIRVPSFTVQNTKPGFAWLTNYIEPGLSAGYWSPSTSATLAFQIRRLLDQQALQSGVDPRLVDLQGHDFSYRGMSSVVETPAASSAAHLLSFTGSDSLVAMDWIERFYGGDYEINSVVATEHSVMSAGIASARARGAANRTSAECMVFHRLLEANPTGVISIVSDTFNLWEVLTRVLPALKNEIMTRDGKLVIRPDSGDPESILCGDIREPLGTPQRAGVVNLLAELFGTTRNAGGYRELDPHIGVIYGDGINLQRSREITDRLMQMRFASTTITLGIGSYTYQHNTRDTFGSALKATWALIDGHGVDLFKDPITDDGTKKSATGRLAVIRNFGDELVLVEQVESEYEKMSLLKPIWEDGQFLQWQEFANVRWVLHGD